MDFGAPMRASGRRYYYSTTTGWVSCQRSKCRVHQHEEVMPGFSTEDGTTTGSMEGSHCCIKEQLLVC